MGKERDDDLKRTLDNAYGDNDIESLDRLLGWDEEDDYGLEHLNEICPSENSRGGSPIILECPKCGNIGKHHVKKTVKGFYHWSDERVEFFKRIAGQDIFYRKRIKVCASCGESFQTIEMSEIFLIGIVNDIISNEKMINSLLDGKIKLKEAIFESRNILSSCDEV